MTEITRREAKEIASRRYELMRRLKSTLIERLALQLDPDEIADDTTLFGTGLGLDSVDALEVAMTIETEFGVQVADEDVACFRSINLIADFISGNRVRAETVGA